MALLTEAQRAECWESFMRRCRTTISTLKPDLRAAIDATDQWLEDNQISFNTALPVAARTTLTSKQKALLLVLVTAKRFDLI